MLLIIVTISSTFCSDNKVELFTNIIVDPPSEQDCQLEMNEEQELPEYTLAWDLETYLMEGTKFYDKSSCEQVWDP